MIAARPTEQLQRETASRVSHGSGVDSVTVPVCQAQCWWRAGGRCTLKARGETNPQFIVSCSEGATDLVRTTAHQRRASKCKALSILSPTVGRLADVNQPRFGQMRQAENPFFCRVTRPGSLFSSHQESAVSPIVVTSSKGQWSVSFSLSREDSMRPTLLFVDLRWWTFPIVIPASLSASLLWQHRSASAAVTLSAHHNGPHALCHYGASFDS